MNVLVDRGKVMDLDPVVMGELHGEVNNLSKFGLWMGLEEERARETADTVMEKDLLQLIKEKKLPDTVAVEATIYRLMIKRLNALVGEGHDKRPQIEIIGETEEDGLKCLLLNVIQNMQWDQRVVMILSQICELDSSLTAKIMGTDTEGIELLQARGIEFLLEQVSGAGGEEKD